VEKMVEVEKFNQLIKCFGIEVNLQDMFLDDHHPGIFYLSAKTKQHAVFLRKALIVGGLLSLMMCLRQGASLLSLCFCVVVGLGMPILMLT
jgi:hypothetical protein